jgi:hypothetical protein
MYFRKSINQPTFLFDQTGKLIGNKTAKQISRKIYRGKFYDIEAGRTLVFLADNIWN